MTIDEEKAKIIGDKLFSFAYGWQVNRLREQGCENEAQELEDLFKEAKIDLWKEDE